MDCVFFLYAFGQDSYTHVQENMNSYHITQKPSDILVYKRCLLFIDNVSKQQINKLLRVIRQPVLFEEILIATKHSYDYCKDTLKFKQLLKKTIAFNAFEYFNKREKKLGLNHVIRDCNHIYAKWNNLKTLTKLKILSIMDKAASAYIFNSSTVEQHNVWNIIHWIKERAMLSISGNNYTMMINIYSLDCC